MHVRKILTFVDESRSEAGQPAQIAAAQGRGGRGGEKSFCR